MAQISVKIVGHSVWDSSYAVYKVEVTAKEKWLVYRRYSEFENLHQGLINELGQQYVNLNIAFPEKDYQGSYFASRTSTIAYRTPLLQKFLNDLIINKVPSLKIKNFLDFDDKGISGARKSLGPKPIMKEAFVRTSYGVLSSIMLYQWRTQYAVLTKNGTLYFMKNMYDPPSAADGRFDLTDSNVHINGSLSSLSIELTCNGQRRFLKLGTNDEFAFWLRSVGEFGMRGTANNAAADKRASAAPSADPNAQSVAPTYIEDSPGTQTDELSASYGI